MTTDMTSKATSYEFRVKFAPKSTTNRIMIMRHIVQIFFYDGGGGT